MGFIRISGTMSSPPDLCYSARNYYEKLWRREWDLSLECKGQWNSCCHCPYMWLFNYFLCLYFWWSPKGLLCHAAGKWRGWCLQNLFVGFNFWSRSYFRFSVFSCLVCLAWTGRITLLVCWLLPQGNTKSWDCFSSFFIPQRFLAIYCLSQF